MPKGVEHNNRGCGDPGVPFVNSSLMPKGVEHREEPAQHFERVRPVNSSLMPKGVEHPRS